MSDLDVYGTDITITVRGRYRNGEPVTLLTHRVDPRCVNYSVASDAPSKVNIEHFADCLCGMPQLGVVRIQPASITCPKCGRTSYNPNDIRERYCGVCGYHDGSLIK